MSFPNHKKINTAVKDYIYTTLVPLNRIARKLYLPYLTKDKLIPCFVYGENLGKDIDNFFFF